MKRAELSTEDFNYDLPDERIAKFPLKDRNQSKLLVFKQGSISQDSFSNLENHLPDDSLLVFNNTKVLTARILFKKPTGATIEVFCLEPYEQTVEESLNNTDSCIWCCMVGNLRKFGKDTTLEVQMGAIVLRASIHEKRENDVLIRFEWDGGNCFSDILEATGKIPLPPYLNRSVIDEDKESYQTVYAKHLGAVAAPTAGLHFVPHQLEALQQRGVALAYLTLYVGAGTFRVVKADKLVDHNMHEERIVITKETLESLLNSHKKIISVGTTSLRSLESLYWLAVKMHTKEKLEHLHVSQDDAYGLIGQWSFREACQHILEHLNQNGLNEIDFTSSLFIMPSYEWKAIDGLITNFHQPKSTLLALVSSWIGEDWRKVYQYALQEDFRFLSYGDSSLLLR